MRLLRAGPVDCELLLYPVVDGAESSAAFEKGDAPGPATRFELPSREPREHGVPWGRSRVPPD